LRKTDSAAAPASRPSIEGRARISFLAPQCPTFYTSRAIDFPDGESDDPSSAMRAISVQRRDDRRS
jgi:hypothetical protein